MKKQDYAWICGLTAAAIGIWARDRAWVSCASDTLPILAGFVLLVWLPWPWTWRSERPGPSAKLCGAALVAGLFGVLLDSTAALALAWVLLLGNWLSSAVGPAHRAHLGKLLFLPFLAFPWMVTDFSGLGWYFRLSAAAVTQHLLSGSHFHVVRQGTFLTVNGFALSVEAACSGLNGLQAMLTAGAALAFLRLRQSRLYWPALLVLPVAAWVANLLRILFAAVVGAQLSPAAAQRWIGPLHLIAGWVAIAVMFALCSALFAAAARRSDSFESWWQKQRRRWPVLELLLIGYAVWQCRSAAQTWHHAPFEQLAWLAFAIWLSPVLLRGNWKIKVAGLAAVGLVAVVAGQLGDLNLLRQAGLAAILGATAPCQRRLGWMLGAFSWLSALGWIGSEVGAAPIAIGLLRLAIAGAAAAAELKHSRAPEPALIELVYDRVK